MTSTVIAAIDGSAAAWPVLEVAGAFARSTATVVQALHVAEDGDDAADALAAAHGTPLRIATGDVASCLVDATAATEVVAIVLGGRGRPGGARPAGHVALEVITRVDKPVIVVPPDAEHPGRLERVLVPTEGQPEGAGPLAPLLARLARSGLQLTALHVDDDASLPKYSDQTQHETEAFAREFAARNLPASIDVELGLRVGHPATQVLAACDEPTIDMVVVVWSRDLSPGRARIVRQLLERSRVPVLLVPERDHASPSGGASDAGRERGEPDAATLRDPEHHLRHR
jgi:nucleotide-binding universal stress UspA family protein